MQSLLTHPASPSDLPTSADPAGQFEGLLPGEVRKAEAAAHRGMRAKHKVTLEVTHVRPVNLEGLGATLEVRCAVWHEHGSPWHGERDETDVLVFVCLKDRRRSFAVPI